MDPFQRTAEGLLGRGAEVDSQQHELCFRVVTDVGLVVRENFESRVYSVETGLDGLLEEAADGLQSHLNTS